VYGDKVNTCSKKIVGIIPAGGKATRIAPLPCSKEVYPIGFIKDVEGNIKSPKVACHFLLEKMKLAGATEVFIVLGKGKWDIPDYLGNGDLFDIDIAYLIQGIPYGAPFTVDQAYPFVKDSIIVFGYPDVLFEPQSAFLSLISKLEECGADIILGIFPADKPQKVDMIDMNRYGRIREIVIKPKETKLKYAWGIAVWTPIFSYFMHRYLDKIKDMYPSKSELYMGNVIQAAILEGMRVEGMLVSERPLLDIGTGDDLLEAVKRFVSHKDKSDNKE
jgi:glucose-1-phosphate thymidylyltransferase